MGGRKGKRHTGDMHGPAAQARAARRQVANQEALMERERVLDERRAYIAT